MILQKYVQYALCFCVGILYSINVNSQSELLQSNWNQYFEPEDVGFSSSKLQLIAEQLASSQTASVLVLYRGNVLFSYGENTRKYMLHSIRKSIMNAMIGVEIKNGSLRLDQTLGELNIDDKDKLTDREKVATIKDLISARSGIYHPSAYSTRSMIANLPERGSHKPGDFWYYNNWDFNALLSIYE